MTEHEEPGELFVGFRYGRPSRWRWLFSFRRNRTQAPAGPEADWTLAYLGTGWTLKLRSCTPGDLDVPLALGHTTLPRDDPQGALLWAEGVLPDGIQHTITQV
jgi:hypothetical protein